MRRVETSSWQEFRAGGPACYGAFAEIYAGLEHDPEKCETGFPKRSCSNKRS